jgi:hypothetical protein
MSLGVARGLRPRRPVAAQYTRGLRPRRPVAAQYTRSLERTPGAGGRGEAGRPRPDVGTEPLNRDCTSKHVCMCRRFSRPFRGAARKTGWRLRGTPGQCARVGAVCVNGETGRDRNGGALAYVPTTYSCTTRRSRPSDSRVRESNRRITRDDRIRPCGLCRRRLCRQTHGRGRMQALLRPRGLCRGPTRTRAWHRPQLSTVKRTHNIPGIGARLNPERDGNGCNRASRRRRAHSMCSLARVLPQRCV